MGAPLFFFYYLPYKERVESTCLRRKHGGAFEAYRAAVPALRPRSCPWRPEAATDDPVAWRFERVVTNDELGTALTVLCAFTVLCVQLWRR
jgi:hypothetical protein